MANPIDADEEPVRRQSAITAVVAVVTAVVTGYGIDLPPEFASSITAGVAIAVNGIMGKKTRSKVTPEAHLPPPAPSNPLGVPAAIPKPPLLPNPGFTSETSTTGRGPL